MMPAACVSDVMAGLDDADAGPATEVLQAQVLGHAGRGRCLAGRGLLLPETAGSDPTTPGRRPPAIAVDAADEREYPPIWTDIGPMPITMLAM
jgi:hypothetical protein